MKLPKIQRRCAVRGPAARRPRASLRVPALGLALCAVFVGGCATRSAEVAPLPSNPAQFAGWSCERIDDEVELVQRRAAELAWAVDERAGNNIVALGVGVAVFWPALLALRPHGTEAEELARLKGRHEALGEAAARRPCPAQGAELSAARAATLPVAAGDLLVYEERPLQRQAATETGWRIRTLRREEIEYLPATAPAAVRSTGAADAAAAAGVDAAAGGAPLRHDRLGNVLAAQSGRLVWPQLLRGELTLGQVMAGEILVMGDALARARVRAQVVAVGPQQVGTKRFDAVVLELFGDVLQAAGSTRLDGVMVVDRASGVLLRLDLRSAQPPFQGTRRLVRIEPAATSR